jgi:hypothetical protein
MMNNKQQWLVDIWVYLLLFAAAALGFWLALQLRTSIMFSVIVLFVRDNVWLMREADIVDKVAIAILICTWVVGVVVVEEYLRKGAAKHLLMKRFARIFGPELLVLFLADLFNLLMLGASSAVWSQWLLLAGELLIGVLITRYGHKALTPAPSGAPRV